MATQLEQLLTCCICLDRFRNPKLLPCQHSVCMEPCMEGLVDYVRRQVKCPECRAEHRIPYNGVQGYPTNVTLQRFLEAHIEITGEQPDPHTGQIMERCAVCNEKNYLTNCSHCDKKICDDCKTAHSDILKREIGRINNQVKRAINRLREQQSGITRYINTLKSNSESVMGEIESIERRLLKAVKDRCNFLKNEADTHYNAELRNLSFIKDGLEQEVSNAESNSELADKHMNDQISWDDCELMDAKEIFLRTMEFIRGFDYDSGEFNRKARFNSPDDLKKIIIQINSIGEFIINNPKQPIESYSTSSLSGGLMKSKSDHRLAAQFREQEDNYLNCGRSSSPCYRRKFGERPTYAENNDDSISDIGRRRFRSRFIRRDDEEERPSKYDDDTPKPRQRVIDTEDVSRGPLSGITRMFDSPRVIKRLQENDINANKKKDEPASKSSTSPTVQSKSFSSLSQRKLSRQHSNDDEIDKIKKQNKSESSLSTASTPTPKPTYSRANSVKDNNDQLSRVTTDRTHTTPRTLTHVATVLDDDTSRIRDYTTSRVDSNTGGSSRKTSIDVGPSINQRTSAYSRSSSTSSIGESSKSSTKPPKPLDTVSIERRLSRSNSTDSNRSLDGATSSRGPTGAAFSTDELKNRFQPKSITNRASSGSTRFQSRFLGRAGTPSAEASRGSGNEEDDEDEDESSEETDSEETEETSEEEEKVNYVRPNSALTGRSSQAHDTSIVPNYSNPVISTNDSGYNSKYGNSSNSSNNINSRYGVSSTTNETKSYQRPSYLDNSKSNYNEKENNFESKYPYASKYLNRTRGSMPPKPTEDINRNTSINTNKINQNGSISKSKSSALLSHHNTQNNQHFKSLSTAGQGSSRAKFEELKEKRQRLARSKSSAGVEEDDSIVQEPVSQYRSRYEKENDTSRTSKSGTSTNTDDSSQLSNWARYLKNKYGNRSAASASGSSGLVNSSNALSRSRSSHLLGLAKEKSTEDNSKNVVATPTTRATGIMGLTPFGSIHRNQYLQKQRTQLKIGSRGSEAGNFTWPRGIAIGPDNIIVVADSSNHRVQVFDQYGNYKKEFGKYGNGDGQFDCLAGVAVNRIGQFIIADRYNHRIQIFDQSGSFLRSFGSQGSSDGKFSYPWGIATDSLGYIYVCDKENHRVQVFQSDGSFAGKFGTMGNKLGQLEHPHYIAVSSTNQVIVSDSNNHRIQMFDINGKVIISFGSEGSSEGKFKFPRGVAVDEKNCIFVADSGNNRIQIFNIEGTFLRSFGCWGSADGEFKGLEGVAVTQKGEILVCDRENHRVQMF